MQRELGSPWRGPASLLLGSRCVRRYRACVTCPRRRLVVDRATLTWVLVALFGCVNEAPSERATTLPGAGWGNLFAARLAPDGSLLWARAGLVGQPVCGGGGSSLAVAIDPVDDSAVFAGYFSGSAVFDQGQPGEVTLSGINVLRDPARSLGLTPNAAPPELELLEQVERVGAGPSS